MRQFLAEHISKLPLEFRILGPELHSTPSPWYPADETSSEVIEWRIKPQPELKEDRYLAPGQGGNENGRGCQIRCLEKAMVVCCHSERTYPENKRLAGLAIKLMLESSRS